MDERKPSTSGRTSRETAELLHRWMFAVLQVIMLGALALAIYERQWLTTLATTGIILLMFLPAAVERRFRIAIPAEFEILALMFIFTSLFLGEVRGYYERFWWWDLLLHTTSGLLLGIVGFLLVYALNETADINLSMRPHFVALFAFVFAVAIGALWEIFEFTMDRIFGVNMQKPMLDDASGLTDTMWDLIVDAVGALIISMLGWSHMKHHTRSFIDLWIQKFVRRNPRLFRK